ncbi:MAG: LPS export ABC transporter permease LptF [Burkholderiales bacterium 66-5]|uniref:LPS export ABC transporter permease LptF n=1 Tax=Comamonas badia TaxID=265291 RepID=UPI00040CD08E|nr:LPS export ABC transporter permease LptF [Comamonas badia]OJU87169.1 MAG: LPS export ABC transporter permease LptF [Burkholderiales bacterium 66-5]
MLFDSSLRKELSRSFGATLVVIVTIVMTIMLVRTLGQASRGSVDPGDVLLVMGFTVLGQLPTILSLSLFVAIVNTLSRMYRDSEMVIWFGAGRGLLGMLAPLLRFAWPIVLAVGALSLIIWPWANQQIDELKTRYEQRSDVDRIAPGEFQETADGSRVFFIDKDTPSANTATKIFVATTAPDRETVTSAKSARLKIEDGQRTALLSNGERLEILLARPGLRISEFAEYGTRIGQAQAADQGAGSTKTATTLALVESSSPVLRAELGWRLGLVLAVFNLVVLGLAVAVVQPRAGRSAGVMFALFAFMAYYNLMNVGQSWVGAQRLSLPALVLGLHGGMLAIGLLILAARHNHWSWRALLPRRHAA